MSEIIQLSLHLARGASALHQLMAATGLTENTLKDAAYKGAIWHQKPRGGKQKRIRKIGRSAALGIGHTLYVNYNPEVLAAQPLKPRLVSDQVNYSVWYKPKGMWTQGSKWADHCTITAAVIKAHSKKALLVHRLDKATSGLIIIAHTKNATQRLSKLFAQRAIEKLYRASVVGEWTQALPYALDQAIDSKPASTLIKEAMFNADNNTTELLLQLETGRKHQIRQHLSQRQLTYRQLTYN